MASLPAAQKTEADNRLAFKKIDAVVTIIKAVCKYGWPVWCMYFVFRIVEVLAGKATFASFFMSIAVSVFGNDKIFKVILCVLAGGGIVYGEGQRRLRRRDIERLTPRPRQLESLIDPNRTTSGLTTQGTTRPEDR